MIMVVRSRPWATTQTPKLTRTTTALMLARTMRATSVAIALPAMLWG